MSSTSFISRIVKKRLGDYKKQINFVDESLPQKISAPKKVAVIGGGLAGVSSMHFSGSTITLEIC
jgi:NADPH-dependent glutamate synthase beta subunit-like oxidoreductase